MRERGERKDNDEREERGKTTMRERGERKDDDKRERREERQQ